MGRLRSWGGVLFPIVLLGVWVFASHDVTLAASDNGSTGTLENSSFQTRHVPIRWVELHASRHPECQNPDGSSFRGPLPAKDAAAWSSSEWLHWMIARVNEVFTHSNVQFWLQSHDVYCTDGVAEWEGNQNTPYPWSKVGGDLEMFFPHAQLYDLSSDHISRERWLEKGYILYGDPHALTLYIHNDWVNGSGGDRISPDILPQHGYAPWFTPAVVFMFLSGITWAPNWQFDPELTPAHEIGHALGLCHTLDFELFCIGPGGSGNAVFPDGLPYTWADHWDLSYVRTAGGIRGFSSRKQAQAWIAANGTDRLRRIDDHFNITLDPTSGRATVTLKEKPPLNYSSEDMVPNVGHGQTRLMRGLSFDFPYWGGNPPQHYAWQRNLLSYRYMEVIDPYDYLTARLSTSQIEIIRRNFQGSTPFVNSIHGIRPAGTESKFASRLHLLGDGETEPFVWYSNGEGPATVTKGDDIPDKVAFRLSPAGSIPSGDYVAGDFNGDGLTDLVSFIDGGPQARFLWSRVKSQDGKHGVHHWDVEIVGLFHGYSRLLAGDFDGDGADDLLLYHPEGKATLIRFENRDGGCRDFHSCGPRTTLTDVEIKGPAAVGNFDGRKGDDIIWVSRSGGVASAYAYWSNGDGTFTPSKTKKRVGTGAYVPHSGNFDGTGGTDILWFDPHKDEQVIWWSSDGGGCGGGRSWGCLKAGPNLGTGIANTDSTPPPAVTIGDFDGNGADDIMIRDSHNPRIFFSLPKRHHGHQKDFTEEQFRSIRTSLRNSFTYRTVVGEFDGAKGADGKRLGDDIFLLY